MSTILSCVQVHYILPGSLKYVLTCCPTCLLRSQCSTRPNQHPACRRRSCNLMVEGIAPVRFQSLSPLRTSPWTSRRGLANNDCRLLCELLQTFSSVHPGLEDDGERLKNSNIIPLKRPVAISTHCIYFIPTKVYTYFCIICFDC